MSFGKDLQQEREKRGVTLESIVEGTKVSMRYLRALEADDYAQMPGGVFNKGIISNYCSFLGLDENEWLQQWKSSRPQSDRDLVEFAEFAENVKRSRPQRGPNMRRRFWGAVLMLLALAALAWGAWHYVLKPRMRGTDTSMPVSASRNASPH
ncbi:MAG: helix-turn-helix transcriptional regulator [Acidobacteriota bacterium]